MPGSLVIAPRTAYAVLLRVEDRRRTCGALVDPVEIVPQSRHPEEDPPVQALDGLFFVWVDVGLGRHRVVGLVRAVGAHVVDGLRLEDIQFVPADVLIVVEEHDGLVPKFLLCLVRVEPGDALGRLPRVDAAHVAVVLVEQVVDAALRDVRQRLRLGEVLPRNDDGHERLAGDAADADAVRLLIYELDGESLDPDHARAPFFASSSIMQVRTKAEKLMPRRASSFAASRKVSGMRRVTDTWSPSTRKLLISVSSGLLLMSFL